MYRRQLEIQFENEWDLNYEVIRTLESAVFSRFEGRLNIDKKTEARISGYIINLGLCRTSFGNIVIEADMIDGEICEAATIAFGDRTDTIIAHLGDEEQFARNTRALFIDRLEVGAELKGERLGLSMIKDAAEALAIGNEDLIFLKVHPRQFNFNHEMVSETLLKTLGLERKHGIRIFASAQDRLKRYYAKAGFIESPRDPNFMYLPSQWSRAWWRVPTIRSHSS